MEASNELVKGKSESAREGSGVVDQRDFAALWAIVVLLSLICTLVGLAWQPVHYEIIPSADPDPMEAMAQNQQNQELVNAINQERLRFDPDTMKKIIAPRPLSEVFFLDLARIILFPTIPTLAIAIMLRKTLAAGKEGLLRKRKAASNR